MRLMITAALLLRRGVSKSDLFFLFSSHRTMKSTLAFDIAERKDKLEGFKVIKEGEVEIQLDVNNGVFYNKTQVNNRDMSIAVLRTFISKRKEEHAAMLSKKMNSEAKLVEGIAPEPVIKESNMYPNESDSITEETNKNIVWEGTHQLKEPTVLEALAASGLRALRYAREIDGIGQVIALDNDQRSIEICKKNIQFNGPVACSKVEAHLADARVYMLTHRKEFDVVDIDPYGSPSMFLDSAVQSVADGGMLMCTATDMAVLCGDDRDVCYSKYGSYPLKGKYCQEMALRVLLASIESHANRYKRHIVPVISVYMDFYIRVFVRIFTSGIAMKEAPLKLSYVYQCVGCDSFHLQCLGTAVTETKNTRYAPGFGPIVHKECSDCGRRFRMGGPIWSAPIHNHEWVASILSNVKAMKERYPAYERISAVLTTISEELLDAPLFLSLHNLCATVKCSSPSGAMFRSAVINAGYRISGTHVNPLGLKTDAPMSIIWDIMRCWFQKHPSKGQPSDQPGAAILLKKPTLQANFAPAVGSVSKAQKEKIARFLPKPEKNWGPKLRAGRKVSSKHASQLGHENIRQVLGHQGTNGKSTSLSLEVGDHVTCNSSANHS